MSPTAGSERDQRLAEIRQQVRDWISVPNSEEYSGGGYTIPATPDDVFWLLAELERVEAEADGPSGLREQLVAARKGEWIEFRMRKTAEERAATLEKALADLGLFIRHDLGDEADCRPCQINRAALSAAETNE